jgi:hypothetical protein
MRNVIASVVMVCVLAGGARAEGEADWPCIQRKQPHLSVGQLWSGPPPDETTAEEARRRCWNSAVCR